MNKYLVRIPLTGYLEVIVEALDADTAYEAAVEKVALDPDQPNLVEWNLHKQVVVDDVFHGLLEQCEIKEI